MSRIFKMFTLFLQHTQKIELIKKIKMITFKKEKVKNERTQARPYLRFLSVLSPVLEIILGLLEY